MPKIKSIRHEQAQKEVLHQVVYFTEDRKIAASPLEFWTKQELQHKREMINAFSKNTFAAKVFFQEKTPIAIVLYSNFSQQNVLMLAPKGWDALKKKKWSEQEIYELPSSPICIILLCRLVKGEINTVLDGVELLQPVK